MGPRPGPPEAGGATGGGADAEIRILGPIEVLGPVGPATLTGARQRTLAGVLAFAAGAVTSRPRLVEALWGADPPRTAVKSLHSHVARVRQAMVACGLPDVLVTREPGYVLAAPRETVDAWRFEDAARAGRRELVEGTAAGAVARLRAGLDLWRGDAFADAPPAGWAAAEVGRLHEVRRGALEDLWDAELRLGHHATAVGELERLLVADQHRERMVGLLMLALYRCGRHSDAVDTYLRLRGYLADELGLDPGPELERLYTAILRRDPALEAARSEPGPAAPPQPPQPPQPTNRSEPSPAAPPQPPTNRSDPGPAAGPAAPPIQLPAVMGHFTGRADLLASLDRLLARPGGAAAESGDHAGHSDFGARVVTVSGAAGLGKTALVLQWAHRVKPRFPDGQIFLDLRGHDPRSALTPPEAFARILPALGVPMDRVPAHLAEQVNLYRSVLDGRRLLVVLDNARTAADVLPLVPATDAAMLIVTSRHHLTALSTHHAVHQIRLDVLSAGESLVLLGRTLGTERVAAEHGAAAHLAELCGRMPLALRIVAAKLAARPAKRIDEMATELATEDRLTALSVEGDSRSVRNVFADAYRALGGPAAAMFRRVGLLPGTSFTAHLAAAAAGAALPATTAGAPLPQARAALDELLATHLVTEPASGRFRCHDLIRLYAGECARLDDGDAERSDVVHRILDWHLGVAQAANRVLDPTRDRVVAALRFPPAELPFGTSTREVLAFLDGERDNLVPVAAYAVQHGYDTMAWQYTYLLTGYYDSRGHWPERLELCRHGLAAAQRLHDPTVEGLMRSALGVACIMIRRYDDALDHLGHALVLMQVGGDRRGEGNVYNNVAVAHNGMRRFDEARTAFERALAVHTANGYPLGIAFAHNNIGHLDTRMGRPEAGFEHFDRALAIVRSLHGGQSAGGHPLEAAVLQSRGQAYLALGRYEEALRYLSEALELHRRNGEQRYAADTVDHLGAAHLARGDHFVALDRFRELAELGTELGDQHLVALAHNNIGQAYLCLGDLDAARAELRIALELRVRTPDLFEEANIHRNLDELEHQSGRPVAAAQHRELAVRRYEKANATAEADRLTARAASRQRSRSRSAR